jgi:hypothetical protein
MSAKTHPCECPICEKVFMARADQMRSAIESGREVPCCSNKCERERRYADRRDAKWKEQMSKIVEGYTSAN